MAGGKFCDVPVRLPNERPSAGALLAIGRELASGQARAAVEGKAGCGSRGPVALGWYVGVALTHVSSGLIVETLAALDCQGGAVPWEIN